MANNEGPTGRPPSVPTVTELVGKIKLAWRLFRDDRVSPAVKAIPLLGLLYLIWPADFLPDLFPALGQLDDVAILVLALSWFIRACPTDVVEDLQGKVETISARYTVVDDREGPES